MCFLRKLACVRLNHFNRCACLFTLLLCYNEAMDGLFEGQKDLMLIENKRLKAENNRLKEENKRLRRQVTNLSPTISLFDPPIESITQNSNTNKNSNPDQKTTLFLSLFKGRTDVFAKRWENLNKGTSGYIPVCANEWHIGICIKPKEKCSSCHNKDYVKYTEKTVNNHLSGKMIVGIYPLLSDDTCHFLVIDFDKSSWKKDVSAISQVCESYDIPYSVERSRSGNGAHIWFFFDDPLPAKIARKLGSALLTTVMINYYQLGFDSYDRFFPNQDTLPSGGFGNLIALPLQKLASTTGNTVFIDSTLVPYEDQWTYLATIKKISIKFIVDTIKKLNGSNELGLLYQDNTEEDKPWEQKKEPVFFDTQDLPKEVTITLSNMLYIPKKHLSSKAINHLMRFAAFKNPEFYKNQAMRLPTYNKPRIIHLAEDFEEYIGLPRGCLEDLQKFFESYQVETKINDELNSGKLIQTTFSGQLTDTQLEAGRALIQHDNGILAAGTAFGKTVIAAWIIGQKKVNTLILVHRQQLLDQWIDRLHQFLPETNIGFIGGGKYKPSGIIDVAILQSLNSNDTVNPLAKDYGMVIIDECHHVSAFSFEKVVKASSAKYLYGLSATPKRQDGHQPILFMRCGPIRYQVDALAQAIKRPFDHIVSPRFTPFKMPKNENDEKRSIQEIYTAITTHEARNNLIVHDVLEAYQEGRNSIVLADRVDHVKDLANRLGDKIDPVIVLSGGMNKKLRSQTKLKLSESNDQKPRVIVATGKYAGEGFDDSCLDTLFLVSPVAWQGTLQQYIGRLHRLYETKKEVRVYDYVDIHEAVLEKMYYKRIKAYKAAGYTIKAMDLRWKEIGVLFDLNTYLEPFYKDLNEAYDQILIVSPRLAKHKVEYMAKTLSPVVAKGIKVTITTSETDDLILAILTRSGLEVQSKDDLVQQYTIIDRSIIWYGSIQILGNNRPEETIMRLQNRDLALEIICQQE